MELVEEEVSSKDKFKVFTAFEQCGDALIKLIHEWRSVEINIGLGILKDRAFEINEVKYESVKLLHIFCAYGLRDYVKAALELGADPKAIMTNEHTGYKYSPLMFAAMAGDVEIVKMLLIKGASYIEAELKDSNGHKTPTLLEIAAHEGNEALVDYLLTVANIDPEFTYTAPNEALLYAVSNNNYAICKKLLLAGLTPDQQLLERRANFNVTRLVKIFQSEYNYAENKLPNNLVNHFWTARKQIRNKHSKEYIQATQLLNDIIDNIDNVEQQRRIIYTLFQATPKLNEYTLALIKSMYQDRAACREFGLLKSETETLDLTQKSAQTTAFNNLKAMKLEREQINPYVNNPRWNGKVFEMLPPFQGLQINFESLQSWVVQPDTLLGMLQKSARENVFTTAKRTFAGVSLLHVMCAYGHTACVDMLLKLGADASLCFETADRKHWYSPLMLAVEYGHIEIAKLLVAHKALYKLDGLVADPTAETPLAIAARKNDLAMVEMLLEHNIDHDAENGFVRYHNTSPTALHWAVKNGNAAMCWKLLQAGADPDLLTELDHRAGKPLLSAHDFCDPEDITFSIPLWIFSTSRSAAPIANIAPEFRLAKYAFLAKQTCDNKVETAAAAAVFKDLLRPIELTKQNQVLITHFNSIPKKFNGYPLTKFDKELMRLILNDHDLCDALGLITTTTTNSKIVSELNLQRKEDVELFLNRLAGRDLASALLRRQTSAVSKEESDSEDYIDGYIY